MDPVKRQKRQSVEINGVTMRNVRGHLRYAVDTIGLVYDLKRKHFVKSYGDDYKYVELAGTRGRLVVWPLHRLVARAWIRKKNGSLSVNHKNGKHDDNRVKNLEWTNIPDQTPLQKRVKRKFTWDHRERLSMAKLGESHPKFTGYYHTPMGRFTSLREVALAYGISRPGALQRFRKGLYGFRFEKI